MNLRRDARPTLTAQLTVSVVNNRVIWCLYNHNEVFPSHADILLCYCRTVGLEWESLVLPSSLVGMGTHVNHNSSNFVCVSQLSDMIYKITK